METHLEVESKWDVEDTIPVPELTRLPKVATVAAPRELTLESTYYDTAEHDLLRAGITLRRRTGGDDAGWHLKLPSSGGGREELREPLRGGATSQLVPRTLRAQVQVHARGRKLVPVATVRNRRDVHRLLAKDGTALAEFCDDHVNAETYDADASATLTSWREWELELLDGSPKILAAADELLTEAGARPPVAASKLARAVGAPASSPTALPQAPTRKTPAGNVLLAHLQEQVETLKAYDPGVRSDLPDAVHKMRVTTRRLRSALATFEPLLDPTSSRALRAELKWLADLLGGARDAEVMRDRLLDLAQDSAPEPSAAAAVDGKAGDLGRELESRHRAAHRAVLRGLTSTRYYRLLDALDDLLGSPPWTSAATKPAGPYLREPVRKDWRRLAKRVKAAQRASEPAERDDALHDARKAAKRLRYACEALTPLYGDRAARLAAAVKELQEVLGEHQDSVVSRQLLHDLADHSRLEGVDVLVLGRLHLLEQHQAERSLAHFEAAWADASSKRLRRWLVD